MDYQLSHFPLRDFPRLTHFGFTRGYRMAPSTAPAPEWLHQHFGFEIKYLFSGRFSFTLHPDLPPMQLAPGDLLVTAPGFAHRFDTAGRPAGYFWLGLQTGRKIARANRSDFTARQNRDGLEICYEEEADADLEALGGELKRHPYLVLHRFWEAERLMEELRAELAGGRRYARQLVHLKLLELFTRMLRRLEEAPGAEAPAARLIRAEAHLRANLDRSVRLAELARVAGLSPAHFSRRFRAHFGRSPVAHAHVLRLEQAKRMLTSGESVTRTATACGFNDPFYFSAFFKSRTGKAPSRWGNG